MNSRAPFGCRQAIIHLLLGDFPVRFHGRFAIAVTLFAGAVQRRRSGVDQVDNTVLSKASQRLAGDALHGFR
ncbi:hypothetical protein D3C81_1331060 [compost metagenome]